MYTYILMRTLKSVIKYCGIIHDYEKRWNNELANILRWEDPDIINIIMKKNTTRKNVGRSGWIVPILLDTIGIQEKSYKAEYLASLCCLSHALIDDATEWIDNKDKEESFDKIASLIFWEKITPYWFSIEITGAIKILNYMYKNIEEKEVFVAALDRMKRATAFDDRADSQWLWRTEVWRAYGNTIRTLLDSQMKTDFSKYQIIIESLFGGVAILDDMSDIFDDYKVKDTRALAMLAWKRPTLSRILHSDMIQKTLADSEKEFQRWFIDIQDSQKSVQKYRNLTDTLKLVYILNMWKKYVQHKLKPQNKEKS